MADKDILDLIKHDVTNYFMWKFGITFLLEAKDLTGYIDGTEEEPDKATKLDNWKKWKKATLQVAADYLE